MTTSTNKSARELAHAYTQAKTAKGRQAIREDVAARASASKRARWGNLLKAIDAGDAKRIAAYASVGEAKREAWAQVRAEDAPAKPKASAPKAKAKAAPKRTPARKADTKLDPKALVAELAGMDDAAFAAFFNALVAARAK